MQISLLLMQQIAQLFLILLMGYAVVKTGLLKASDSKVLSVVFVYLVMPCVVLNAFQIKDTPEIRTGLLYSMSIAVGMHVVFLLLNALFRKALKLDAGSIFVTFWCENAGGNQCRRRFFGESESDSMEFGGSSSGWNADLCSVKR